MGLGEIWGGLHAGPLGLFVIAFLQALVAFGLDGAVVAKHVGSVFTARLKMLPVPETARGVHVVPLSETSIVERRPPR